MEQNPYLGGEGDSPNPHYPNLPYGEIPGFLQDPRFQQPEKGAVPRYREKKAPSYYAENVLAAVRLAGIHTSQAEKMYRLKEMLAFFEDQGLVLIPQFTGKALRRVTEGLCL